MRIKNYIKRLDKVAKKEHKSTFILVIDMLFWYVYYGATLTDYLNYEFYNKSFKDRKTYAVVRTQNKFYEKVSPSKYKEFFTIKPNFLNNFKDYIKRDYYVLDMGKDKLKEFLNKHDEFMIKPIDGLGGAGVEKLYTKDINIDDLYETIVKDNCFLEEVVKQHKTMNKLCKASVNTIRIMTYVDNNKSKVLYATLRVGNGKYAVDNFHKGGMGINIDLDTGKLVGKAIDKDLNEYECHPVTKVKFDGFKLPYWEEVKELVLKASLVNQNIHLVGWDIAISEDGPVIIEGNRRPGFDIVQVVSRRGRMDIINSILRGDL